MLAPLNTSVPEPPFVRLAVPPTMPAKITGAVPLTVRTSAKPLSVIVPEKTSGLLPANVTELLLNVTALASVVGERASAGEANRWASATRFSYALVPLGFAMWLSHYSFHLLTSWRSALPAAQRFVAHLGWPILGTPAWSDACCRPAADWLPRLEIVCLDLGLLLSLYCGCRIARGHTPAAWGAFVPWALLIVLLFAMGVWIVLQPMQMRGTLARMG